MLTIRCLMKFELTDNEVIFFLNIAHRLSSKRRANVNFSLKKLLVCSYK